MLSRQDVVQAARRRRRQGEGEAQALVLKLGVHDSKKTMKKSCFEYKQINHFCGGRLQLGLFAKMGVTTEKF
jgi:hypothetical protein